MKEEKQQMVENHEQEESKRSVLKAKKERKFFKKKNVEERPEKKSARWVQIRLIPIWLRLILILLLFAVVSTLGLYIGYSVVGDGSPNEIFKKETWTHITDIIQGIE